MAVYPPQSLSAEQREAIVDYTTRIALALDVRGLLNVQYVIAPEADPDGPGVFVIEVNPRASRTVPFISKVTGVPLVQIAVQVILGRSLSDDGYSGGLVPARELVAVKAPVFSMSKLIGVDTYLGPEMKSTGEVMGVDRTFAAALHKALIASDLDVAAGTPFLLSLANRTKSEAVPLITALHDAGCALYATEGTAAMVRALGIPVEQVTKRLNEGYPNVVDVIGEQTVRAVINTLEGGRASHMRDGFHIRRAATEARIPCFTSLDTARAAIRALSSPSGYDVRTLSEYRDGSAP
jgi:carbamoyl-phosphate synthase large subunit